MLTTRFFLATGVSWMLLGAVSLLATPSPAQNSASSGPSVVKIVKGAKGGYQLLRNGRPFFIKGAGGDGPKQLLHDSGANSIRTWGADNLEPLLDEARKLGMTVTVGIWLGQIQQGFNYSNADQVAAQYEQVRKTVLRYKNHPAVLMWALGNEMEGYGKGDNVALWTAINNLAGLVKKLDPNHPTMTVVAEIGGDRVKDIHRYCPNIDIVGINSYAGVASIPIRYRAAGGVKPYVVTEFGPPGTWEMKKNAWGVVAEPTSTEKAEYYRRGYQRGIASPHGLCLGSYAFVWGAKQEATATWFGMLLPDGSRLGAVDAMTTLWSGKPPVHPCPQIHSLKLDGTDQVEPGATVQAKLDVSDPQNDPLTVNWVLQHEVGSYNTGGGAEQAPPTYPEAILHADSRQTTLHMPPMPGGYRLFAYVRDAHGGAAVANVPLRVKGAESAFVAGPGKTAQLPLVVYDEADRTNPSYAPSGWMGNTKAIKMDLANTTMPHSGKTCLRFDYTEKGDWGGVVWQNPPNDWGDHPGGLNLTGATKLTFWARGEKGGEVVTFLFGLVAHDKPFFDTAQGKLESVKLTDQWQQFSLDLKGKDLTRVKTAFAWTLAARGEPITFYLDDIRYE